MRHSSPDCALPIRWRDVPMVGTPKTRFATFGQSISEILAGLDDLPPGFDRYGTVCINGQPVARAMWGYVRPKFRASRDVIITLHVPLHGGGGDGGKNIFGTIASIVLLVATAGIASGGLVPLLGAGFAAGTVGANLAAAGVSLVGSLAVAALTAPPSIGAVSGGQREQSDLKSASLSANILAQGQIVPRVVGTHRVFPPLITEPLIEPDGQSETVEAVYALAGPHKLDDIRIGGVPVNQIPDLIVETREGWADDTALTLVERYGKTVEPDVQVNGHSIDPNAGLRLDDQINPGNSLPAWHPVKSRVSPDQIWIDLVWPQGIISETDADVQLAMPVRMRMRQKGNLVWLHLPELHFSASTVGLMRQTVKFVFDEFQPSSPPAPSAGDQVYLAYTTVPAQDIDPTTIGGWQAHGHFYSGSGDIVMKADNYLVTGVQNVALYPDRVEFYFLNATDFPKGEWEVEIMRGFPYAINAFNSPSYELEDGMETHIFDFFGYRVDSEDAFSIPVNTTKIRDDLRLTRVKSVWNENPSPSTDFALIAIRGSNRSFRELSVLASGYVRDWDGALWENWTTTSNPAPHFRDVLTGRLGGQALPVSLIDQTDILEWRTHCETEGYTCDTVFDQTSMFEAATVIAGAGRARPRQSEKFGVLIDKDRSGDAPVQVFSPRNSASMSFEMAFPVRPSGLRVKFSDSANDYQETEILVLDPDAKADSGLYEEVRYDGPVTEAAATERALFDMKQARLRSRFYSLETDSEGHIVCRRGDLVAVQSDVLARQAGFSRIVDVEIVSGDITRLILDGTVSLATEDAWSDTGDAWSSYSAAWVAPKYGAAIRKRDGTITIVEVTADDSLQDTRLLSLVSPIADSGAQADGRSLIDYDCQIVTGPLGTEYKRLLVADITPKGVDRATLSLIDEAPGLWAA